MTESDKFTHLATHEVHDPLLECLVVLSHLYNRPTSAASLKVGLPLQAGKFTPKTFKRAAIRINIDAELISKNFKGITNDILPCVLLLKNGDSCILKGLSEKGAQVIFPGGGNKPRAIPLNELEKRYDGDLILVRALLEEPIVSAESSSSPTNWFWGTLLQFWPIYSQVIVTSLFINFFTLASTIFVMAVYDRVVPNNATTTLWVLAIGVFIIFIFDFILRILRNYFLDVAGKNADILLASRLYEHMLGMRLEARPKSSGTLAHQLREFESLREFISSATLSALVDLPFIFLFIFIIWLIAGPVAYVPLVMVPLVLIISYFLQRPLASSIRKTYVEGGQKHALLVQSLQGLETIKGLNAEGKMQEAWESFVAQSASSTNLTRFLSTLAVHLSMLVQNITIVGVMIVGVYQIADQALTMGGLIACSILSGRAMGPLTQVVSLLTRLNQSLESLKRLNQLIQLPLERPAMTHFVHRPHFEGVIEFNDVDFAYPGHKNLILQKVSFKLLAGERVALLGRIGSGKTTIEKLILGFYVPKSGSVLIDGTDIRQIDPSDLRANIGYIPQDIFLFGGSIRHNITLGGEGVDDQTLLRAATLAGVHDFVSQHPLGYDIPVGEGGGELSGGQRQTIAVARAFVKDPSIFLFDEPSAMMDSQAENVFIQRLQEILKKNKTLIIVTHRPSLLALVDRIIVIDKGRIVADGPKQDILEALQSSTIRTTS
ncbi:MAG: type I secretion system permease/ATPase [Alphaproteobacteria bacterium]|nr:type I secretion system permease/ATPase [Alphaproteobacteria bacterium]